MTGSRPATPSTMMLVGKRVRANLRHVPCQKERDVIPTRKVMSFGLGQASRAHMGVSKIGGPDIDPR